MTTKLEKVLKREIQIDGVPHIIAISDVGVILTRKRFRNGAEITWRELQMRQPANQSAE